MCPLTISHVIPRPICPTWLRGVRSHVRITEKYKTSLSEYAVVTTAVNTYSLQYVILFPGPSSGQEIKRYAGEQFGKQSAVCHTGSFMRILLFLCLGSF